MEKRRNELFVGHNRRREEKSNDPHFWEHIMAVTFDILKGHKDFVTSMLNHPLGLVSGSEDKTVRLWDLRLNRAVKCICGAIYDDVSCLSQFPGNDNYVCVGCDTSAMVFDLRNTSTIIRDLVTASSCNEDCVNRIRPVTVDEEKLIAICDDKG